MIALRLVRNPKLVPELRMDALVVLFDTNPGLNIVRLVASILKRESNLQVAHFGYTLMKSLSISTIPDRHAL